MPYQNRIKTLEESHRLVDNQLFQLEKSGVSDPEKVKKLREAKQKYLTELQQLRRAQWEYEHDTHEYDDDR